MKWVRFPPMGLGLDDDSSLYVVDVPKLSDPAVIEWVLVERHAPTYAGRHVAGPFPTKDAAKAAYLILAPRYPGP